MSLRAIFLEKTNFTVVQVLVCDQSQLKYDRSSHQGNWEREIVQDVNLVPRVFSAFNMAAGPTKSPGLFAPVYDYGGDVDLNNCY